MTNNHWQTIEGWFTYKALYDKVLEQLQDNDIIVELGTWLGKSTCYLGQQLKEKELKVKFYACDLFINPMQWQFAKSKQCSEQNFYSFFYNNLVMQGIADIVIPKQMNSLDLSKEFTDNSISFIFIDDEHTTEHVYNELCCWYPKMKPNSLIAGHDSNSPYVMEAVFKFAKKDNLDIHIVEYDRQNELGCYWYTYKKDISL